MSPADDSRDDRPRRGPKASAAKPAARIVIGDEGAAFYLARIAELEEEVSSLRAKLAELGVLDVAVVKDRDAAPVRVTADGTQGMHRGVSDG